MKFLLALLAFLALLAISLAGTADVYAQLLSFVSFFDPFRSSVPSQLNPFCVFGQSSQSGDCNVELGLQCAGALAQCFPACKHFKSDAESCLSCLGDSVSTCCPCLKKAFGPDFPC